MLAPPDDDDAREAPPRRSVIERVARLVLPISILALVLAVFVGEQTVLTHELHLVAPEEAPPGATIPIRTLLFGDLEAMSGARVVEGEVTVTVSDASGLHGWSTTLTSSRVGGQEGSLSLPPGVEGDLSIRAIATIDQREVARVDRPIRVHRDAVDAPPVGRPSTALQLLAPQPIELAYEGAIPPSRFEARVVGAACVPDVPCTLLVYVGEPAAAVRIEGASDRSVETTGIVALDHTVRGPEAEVVLEAVRGDVVVARRRVRLPVALATPGLVIDEDGDLRVEVLGDPPGVIIDQYAAGRWVDTRSVEPSLAFALPDPETARTASALVRVQARTDRFSSERAATRVIRADDASEEEVVAALRALGADPHPEISGPWFEWAASALEASVQLTPRPTSGHHADVARIEARQRTLRIAAALGMGLCIVVLVLYFLRRGVEAAMLAQGVMDATEDPVLSSPNHRRKTLLSALAIVATLLLALIGAAALIAVRGHLFT